MTGQFKGDERLDVRDSTDDWSAFREATAPDTEVPEFSAANTRGRSFKILAQVEIDDADAGGVIFAHGARFGGHSLFVKDRKLYYVYNFIGVPPEQKLVYNVVSEEYRAPSAFTGGRIGKVEVSVGDDAYVALEQQFAAAVARD